MHIDAEKAAKLEESALALLDRYGFMLPAIAAGFIAQVAELLQWERVKKAVGK